jgi:hypothetical protein
VNHDHTICSIHTLRAHDIHGLAFKEFWATVRRPCALWYMRDALPTATLTPMTTWSLAHNWQTAQCSSCAGQATTLAQRCGPSIAWQGRMAAGNLDVHSSHPHCSHRGSQRAAMTG